MDEISYGGITSFYTFDDIFSRRLRSAPYKRTPRVGGERVLDDVVDGDGEDVDLAAAAAAAAAA